MSRSLAGSIKRNHPSWNKVLLIRCIRSLNRAEVPLSWTDLKQADKKTINSILRPVLKVDTTGMGIGAAARKHFGSWDAALRASDLDPIRIRRGKSWNKELIIHCLRALSRTGVPLNFNSLCRDNDTKMRKILRQTVGVRTTGKGLYTGALLHFGSWNQTLKAAGFNPAQCRKDNRFWDEKTVIHCIRTLHSAGHPLNRVAIFSDLDRKVREILFKVTSRQTTGRLFYQGAECRFGTWQVALRTAGLDPLDIYLNIPFWSKKLVCDCIRTLHKAEIHLNYRSIFDDKSTKTCTLLYKMTGRRMRGIGLFLAGKKRFGSWDLALAAAGLDPDLIRRDKPKWDTEKVARAIIALNQMECPLNCESVRYDRTQETTKLLSDALGIKANGAKLQSAAARLYGSWGKALEAAGLNAFHISLRNRRTCNLPIISHQEEWITMPDGRSRKVAYMGTLPKPPEAAIQERLIAARLEQAVAGLCKEERELATAVFDVIADIDTFEGHSDLVIAIQERLDGMVSVQTISALLLKLADSPFLKTLKENDCLDN